MEIIYKNGNNYYIPITKEQAFSEIKYYLKKVIRKGKHSEITSLIEKNIDLKKVKNLAKGFDYSGDNPITFLKNTEPEVFNSLLITTDLLDFDQLIEDYYKTEFCHKITKYQGGLFLKVSKELMEEQLKNSIWTVLKDFQKDFENSNL